MRGLLIIGGVTVVSVLALAGPLLLPAIDEGLGFFTHRAVRLIQSRVDAAGYAALALQGTGRHWRAFHQDSATQTFVEYAPVAPSRRDEQAPLWYVEERPTLGLAGLKFRVTHVTALNRAALEATPQLFDQSAGFGLDQWRPGVELPP